MSVSWQVLLALAASAVGVLLVHSLRRKPSRIVTVATLRPFDAAMKPRWRPQTPDQIPLMLVRLLLLALLAWLLVTQREANPLDIAGSSIVAVKPGSPVVSWQRLVEQADAAVWLDAALTPIQEQGVQSQHSASLRALSTLDQRLAKDVALAVVGDWDAEQWPLLTPTWSRPVRFIKATPRAGRVAFRLPPTIYLVALEPEVVTKFRNAVSLWQQYLLGDSQPSIVETKNLPSAAVADAWWLLGSDQLLAPLQALDRAANYRLVDTKAAATMSDEALATEYWMALSQSIALQPPAGYAAKPTGAQPQPLLAASRPRQKALLPPALLWLLALTFALERLLSIRRGQT